MTRKWIMLVGLFPIMAMYANSDLTGKCGDKIEITATPQQGYHFVQWNDGSTEQTRTVIVSGNATYRAYFAINKYEISFRNDDGTDLQKDSIEHGKKPTYNGITPTKAATAQYTYTFAGWNPTIVEATQDQVYTAYYDQKVRSYIIAFTNYDGQVLQSQELEYGTMPSYTETPIRPATAQYTYTFKGWDHTIETVSGADTYVAQYDSTVNIYHIVFNNYDGSELASYDLPYGSMPEYSNGTPTKSEDKQYTYTFTGWDKTISSVTGDATYTAQFTPSLKSYTIVVEAENGGTATGGGTFPYGTQVTITATADDCYVFAQWHDGNTEDERVVTVTEDMTFTAQFSDDIYTIHVISDDSTMGNAEGRIIEQL